MFKEILVQVDDEETKVAVLEDGQLIEIYLERAPNSRLVGNIYKGIVRNVLPGMQAAFVDIGLEKNSFLYVEDALANTLLGYDNSENKEGTRPNICDVVKVGQEIIVQIEKEPVGTKGARVTTQITLPGRMLVLMPTADYIGISRRIEDEEERERLRTIAEEIRPDHMGVIVRTVAEGVQKEELQQDINSLLKIWERIQQRGNRKAGATLIHRDLELVQRTLRDVFNEDVKKLSVNSRTILEQIIEFLDVSEPELKSRVVLSDTQNLLARYAVDQELERALKRKVWLKSGGYIIIDQTEALTAIDVNTGKFVGSTDLADTVFKTNREAAREIIRQLRLRNIGGIIIIDFIDMHVEEHKEQVLKAMEEELKKDKVKTHILGITSLGLVEMTRKKVGQSLTSTLERTCPYCEGKGRILSEDTIYLALRKELLEAVKLKTAKVFMIEAHSQVIEFLVGEEGEKRRELEENFNIRLIIKERSDWHINKYNITPLYT